MKKEERLSPTAKGILNKTRKAYATSSKNGARYLISAVTENRDSLTPYDMAKLAREFYARTDGFDPGYRVFEGYKGEQRVDNYSFGIPIGGVPETPGKNILRKEALAQARELVEHYEGYARKEGKEFNPGKHDLNIIVNRFKDAGHYREALKYAQMGGFNASEIKGLMNRVDTMKAKRKSNLEGITSILGIIGGIFLLSPNITGNAIADLTTKTTSFLGAGLLIVGLIAGFYWVKSRKSN